MENFKALSPSLTSLRLGFVHIHSGRSAATDAPFTLVILLSVVTLRAEKARPWQRIWLGPLLATAFLLRGMAVLMPLALVIVVLLARERGQNTAWKPTLGALALFLLPVAAWVVARYQVDG
jgi:4-amino-4-deoxy-L-arabinose transferase-like glycosyltransferase